MIRPLRFLLLLGLLAMGPAAAPTVAQVTGVLQVDDDIHRFLFRQQVAGRIESAHLSNQPLSAADAVAYLDSLELERAELSLVDQQLLDRYRRVLPAPGAERVNERLSGVYANGHDFISASSEDWSLALNPLFVGSYGVGQRTAGKGPDDRPTVWQNSRGAQFAGTVGPWLFFEGRVLENQQRVVNPMPRAGSAPRRAFAKYSDGVYDWFDAVGVVGLRSKYLEARFGRDRYRLGYGLGSPYLSNYPPPIDHLLLKARFWRLEYLSLMAGYSDDTVEGSPVRRRKYGSTHRLAIHLPGRVEVALFETVVFATDSLEIRERFDLSYANPVIFLRAAEGDRGSPDNALLGASAAWRPVDGVRVFAELLLDEFKADMRGKQWWANKWVWNWGVHVADWPVDRLATRVEVARLRPFMYSHRDPLNSYTHFGDILGHPAGPNAWDYTLALDYQASTRVHLSAIGALTRRGRNANGINYGSDPLIDYNTGRQDELGHAILQGVRQTQILAEAYASYEFLPDLSLDLAARFQSLDDAERGLDRWFTPFVQLRWGVPFPSERW